VGFPPLGGGGGGGFATLVGWEDGEVWSEGEGLGEVCMGVWVGDDGGGAPGAVHGLLHAVCGVEDLFVDVGLDGDEAGVDLDGGVDVALQRLL